MSLPPTRFVGHCRVTKIPAAYLGSLELHLVPNNNSFHSRDIKFNKKKIKLLYRVEIFIYLHIHAYSIIYGLSKINQ